MKKIILTLLIFGGFNYSGFAQKIGIQFYQGVNKPMVSFSGENNTLDYSSNFNSDTRLGVCFGDLKKISAAALFGVSNVKARAINEDLVTTFTNSSLRLDVPVRYAFPESFVSSIAVGPSVGLLVSSSQTMNGIPIRSEGLFTVTNFYVSGEIDFTGYSSDKLNMYPYVSYRMMLNNADIDTDNLKINELSFGLRIDISK